MTPISSNDRDAFTPFLNRALAGKEHEVFQLAGDASARRYFRVVSDNESSVLMVWEPFKDDEHYPFLSVLKHFAKHGVQVPEVIDMNPDQGLVLLEDLGDLTLERKFWENQSQKVCVPFYQLSIDELIKMHYSASADRSHCTAFKVAFDVDKLMWEMNYGRDHLLVQLCEIKLSELERKELERVFTSICTSLHQEPKFIAHRDYHSRNIMLKHGKARIIDFQDARMGPVQYDLVSLLRDSYVNMEEAIARELLGYYLDRRRDWAQEHKASIGEISIEHFSRVYELQTIQRCFKACGSFASFFNLRSDTRYLKYLAPTLQRVRTSLAAFDEYRTFLTILDDHGVFEKTFDGA